MSHSSSEMSLSSKEAKERSHQARVESTGNQPHAERIGVLQHSPNPNDYADRPSEAVRRTGQARGAARAGDTSSLGTSAGINSPSEPGRSPSQLVGEYDIVTSPCHRAGAPQRLQSATSVRSLQHVTIYNQQKATETYTSRFDAMEQNLEKERLLRNEQRRVRDLEQELRHVEGLLEQCRDQVAKMDKLLDKQQETEEVLLTKVDELYHRLEEKQAKEQDLIDKMHGQINAELKGRRVIEHLEQECRDLKAEKNEWKDKCSEKETELSEVLERVKYVEDYLSASRGPGWDLDVASSQVSGSGDLCTDGEDAQLQGTSERYRHPSQQLRHPHRPSNSSNRTGRMVTMTPDIVEEDNLNGDAASLSPKSGQGHVRGALSGDLSSGPSKDLFTGRRNQARETVQPRQSPLTGDSRGRQGQRSAVIDQAPSRKQLRGESYKDSAPKRQRTGTTEANTVSRRQSVTLSVPAISTPGPSRGSASVESHSIVIDTFDARRGIIPQALPASVKEVLRQQISVWNKKKDKWQRRNDSERPQCLNSLADKKSTTRSYSDDGSQDTNHACTDCEDRGRVCATMSGFNALKILPVRNKGFQYDKYDARFWIAESDNASSS